MDAHLIGKLTFKRKKAFGCGLGILIAVLACAFRCTAGPAYEPIAAFEAGPGGPGSGSLLLHPDGNFYGTAPGGAASFGTIYKVTPLGEVDVVVQFTGKTGVAKGKNPQGALVVDANGFLWGTTTGDGVSTNGTDYGSVFKVDPSTGELTVVAEFTGPVGPIKGAGPSGALVSDGKGNFWGTTTGSQGIGVLGFGTIFKVDVSTGVLLNVVEFTGPTGAVPGSGPAGGLVLDENGFFWGAATGGPGSIFKVNSTTGEFISLANFNTASLPGRFPRAGLAYDGNGFFWGTTSEGGIGNFGSGSGTIFKIRASTGVASTVIRFTGSTTSPKGLYPYGVLANAGNGYLWGTTKNGGEDAGEAYGTLFKINTTTGALTTMVLFGYQRGPKDGLRPIAGVVSDGMGAFWGTTSEGGSAANLGTIFKVDATTGELTTLHQFTGTNGPVTGKNPFSGIVSDGNGSLLGMTRGGGRESKGTIFKLADDSGAITTLAEFTPSMGVGAYPYSTLVGDG